MAFEAFGIAIQQDMIAIARQISKPDQLFHHINHAVVKRAGLHAIPVKFGPDLGYRGLVWDRQKPHPTANNAQLIKGIKRLATATSLHDGQDLALCRPHPAQAKGNPVDLCFHDPGHCTMAFGAAPDHALALRREFTQLCAFGVIGFIPVGQGQASRIKNFGRRTQIV